MSRERATWVSIAILLLIIGLLIGRQFLSPLGGGEEAAEVEGSARSFQQWFWENRGLDLLVQVGLIFAGALGVAALLPRGREEDV